MSGMAATRRKSVTCSGAFTKRASSGAASTTTSAMSTPSPACILSPARCTAPARASSSAVNLETDWMVPCTMVLFTVEMALFTTEKAPYSAGPTTRASSTRCRNPASMKNALAKPMNSAPRPASTARSGRLDEVLSVTGAQTTANLRPLARVFPRSRLVRVRVPNRKGSR